MNRNKLKAYAPKARRDFIKAVKDRAAFYGLTKKKIEPVTVQGDVAIIGGKPFPKDVAEKRGRLEERIGREGFEQVMEAMAYTWFNRFVAIRFMEVHGYLEHGYRVFSTTNSTNSTNKENKSKSVFLGERALGVPEVLGYAEHLELPGVDRGKVVELKLAGNRDEELYRMLLVGQCNALHKAMPFLFERIGDATELLLPENLLHSDSLVRNLVNEIPEEDRQEIEIIGWLYQFYISEKKDDVIGKVVKSEDIPAATQLFTPNWIVKYMVQNSLGSQWLATYPNSPLKGKMEYYIEPAEQTDDVKAQLAAITPSQLNPEELTLIDPACGSGHILVEAYELFKAIYLERGYRQRDVARLIVEKNLFGLEICGRAAQLTGFALMMKGRADDRRLFERGVKLNVMAIQNSPELSDEALEVLTTNNTNSTNDGENGCVGVGNLRGLLGLFEHGKTFGSLIRVPEDLATKLSALKKLTETTTQDLFVSDALKRLRPLVRQAEMLAARYDAVVANPPYMGVKYHSPPLKKFTKDYFPEAKNDLFACFIDRGFTLSKKAGFNAMVFMQSWMFLSSFEKTRERMLREKTICTMAHLGARAFGSISGEVVQTTACVLQNRTPKGYKPTFFRLVDGGEDEKRMALVRSQNRYANTAQDDFTKIPGSPVAYWMSDTAMMAFGFPSVGSILDVRAGLTTGSTERFLRYWQEIPRDSIGSHFTESGTYIAYDKGGEYRKWFGNKEYVLSYSKQSLFDMKTVNIRVTPS